MKKIKALKNYIYAPYSRDKGETVTAPDAVADRLVRIGFAEYVTEGAQTAQEPPAPSGDKTPAPAPGSAQRPPRKRTAGKK